MKFASLAEWLGWLEQSHPKEIDLGLDRIRKVAERMDLLKPRANVITVAGTNGKGSCVTATAGLLQAANKSVGVYTSPHLLHYAERIQINGKPVPDELICTAFEKIADACTSQTENSTPISLTYFEYGTLAALEIFKQQAVDYIVLEVGLGGRLDAVNIIDADVAIITSIAIDHQDWLGDTREAIGREKAGILRENQLFVCADSHPPQSILDVSQQLNTQSYFIGSDFSFIEKQMMWSWRGKGANGEPLELPVQKAPHLPLPSMAAALQCIGLLNIELSADQIENALLGLHLAGRFQKIFYQEREFVLDVAHNPAATQYLASRLSSESIRGKTLAIVAMMSDKDRSESLANIAAQIDGWFVLDLPDIARAASVQSLSENLHSLDAKILGSGPIDKLICDALGNTKQGDRVLVFGSFYTVAAALGYLQAN